MSTTVGEGTTALFQDLGFALRMVRTRTTGEELALSARHDSLFNDAPGTRPLRKFDVPLAPALEKIAEYCMSVGHFVQIPYDVEFLRKHLDTTPSELIALERENLIRSGRHVMHAYVTVTPKGAQKIENAYKAVGQEAA